MVKTINIECVPGAGHEIGCYADSVQRDLPEEVIVDPPGGMTHDICTTHCQMKVNDITHDICTTHCQMKVMISISPVSTRYWTNVTT